MKNLILTTLSDSLSPRFSSQPEVDVFLRSARNVPNTDLIILSDLLNRPLPHIVCPPTHNILLDRWLYFYQILLHTSYGHVLITDSKDVLIQEDPFSYSNGKVILSGEGVLHGESSWNTAFQEKNLESIEFSASFKDWPVVNGGVVVGPHAKVRDYCLLVYTNVRQAVVETDQPMIGWLWNSFLKYNPDYTLSNPAEDTFCITGETIKQHQLKRPVIFENGKLCSQERIPYALFHQWDRTHYREEILQAENRNPKN